MKSKILIQSSSLGFTLVELMVAMTLSIGLLWSMSKIFISNKSMITTQNNIAKIQDDAKFSLFLMENDLALSGFRGCSSGAVNTSSGTTFYNVSGTAGYLNSTNFIQGYQGSGTSFSPSLDTTLSGLSPAANPKMDILISRSVSNNPTILTADMTNSTSALTVGSASNLVSGNNAIISNCYTSSLFNISSISGNTVTPSASLTSTYSTGSEVFPYNTTTYYVGTDNTLYRKTNSNTADPIAYNVEKFSVLYGVDTDSNTIVNKYVYASGVSNFNQVVSIRVGLVIKSNDSYTIGTSNSSYSYNFNGSTYTPGDNKLRKVYYTTIALRNMLP